jgi:hypothetical protein
MDTHTDFLPLSAFFIPRPASFFHALRRPIARFLLSHIRIRTPKMGLKV